MASSTAHPPPPPPPGMVQSHSQTYHPQSTASQTPNQGQGHTASVHSLTNGSFTYPTNQPMAIAMPNQSSNASSPIPKEQNAFQYEGIPAFAKWMDSTDDFFVIRRFGSLNARIILRMQDRIVCAENKLHKIDESVRNSTTPGARNDSFRADDGSLRDELLQNIQNMLKEYNEYIAIYSPIKAQASAPDHQIRNIKAWFWNHQNAIRKDENTAASDYENEQEFVEQSGDLISLVPKIRSPLRYMLQKEPKILRWNVFKASSRSVHQLDSSTHRISERGFDWFVSGLITISGLLLLFGPIWWLQWVDNHIKRLGIITAFVCVFTLLLTISTTPRPFEVLAASAAYTAVLLVYLQIGNQNGNSN